MTQSTGPVAHSSVVRRDHEGHSWRECWHLPSNHSHHGSNSSEMLNTTDKQTWHPKETLPRLSTDSAEINKIFQSWFFFSLCRKQELSYNGWDSSEIVQLGWVIRQKHPVGSLRVELRLSLLVAPRGVKYSTVETYSRSWWLLTVA